MQITLVARPRFEPASQASGADRPAPERPAIARLRDDEGRAAELMDAIATAVAANSLRRAGMKNNHRTWSIAEN